MVAANLHRIGQLLQRREREILRWRKKACLRAAWHRGIKFDERWDTSAQTGTDIHASSGCLA